VKVNTGRKSMLSTCKSRLRKLMRVHLCTKEGNQQKKPIDEELTKNLFGLVGFSHEILMLLKFNVG
jgi:hypothetical protein